MNHIKYASAYSYKYISEYQDSLPRLKLTSTLPKQIIDILEKSGSSGITLNVGILTIYNVYIR